jgi:uncharacterized protein
MPVRSCTASVFRWPDAQEVDGAVRRWAAALGQAHADVLRIGYMGSYVRGDWGVGSDVDLFVLVERSERPFGLRAAVWDSTALPVPADVWVYTVPEWEVMVAEGRRLAHEVRREAVWVYERP